MQIAEFKSTEFQYTHSVGRDYGEKAFEFSVILPDEIYRVEVSKCNGVNQAAIYSDGKLEHVIYPSLLNFYYDCSVSTDMIFAAILYHTKYHTTFTCKCKFSDDTHSEIVCKIFAFDFKHYKDRDSYDF